MKCFCILFCLFLSCVPNKVDEAVSSSDESQNDNLVYINQDGKTIEERFIPPENYYRPISTPNGFSHYLRDLKLKSHDSKSEYYNGEYKSSEDVYCAVLDQAIGNKDLHQCADAIIRLKAEYLWDTKQYDKIAFNLTNGMRVNYNKWLEGFRVKVEGNKTSWYKASERDVSYNNFWSYLEFIFTYAGTASLSKEMQSKSINEAQIGDVFIRGGFPGHAVIIIDEVIHQETYEKLFLLAQSYMPAQQMQILVNPKKEGIDPWYSLNNIKTLETPEWTFDLGELKGF